MCACDFNYVCLDHRGTAHDPWAEFEDDPREQEQLAHERLISRPDFLSPFAGEAR